VKTLKLDKGFYRATNSCLQIIPSMLGFCEGSANAVNPYCTVHHQGHLCAICEEGYVHQGPLLICNSCDSRSPAADDGHVAGVVIGALYSASCRVLHIL
jgi:hypothetical protein